MVFLMHFAELAARVDASNVNGEARNQTVYNPGYRRLEYSSVMKNLAIIWVPGDGALASIE